MLLQIINITNMHSLFFRKIALLIILTLPAFAQTNYHRYDIRKFNLGFAMGGVVSDVRFQRLYYDTQAGTYIREVHAKPILGITLGMITNTKLSWYWDLRFIPSVSLQQRNFELQYRDSTVVKKLEASYLDLPIGIKYKSDVWNDYRVYIYSGLKYSINLMSDKKVKSDPNLIRIDRTDISWEIAVGMDLYGARVKLSPEIKYSIGLKNIYIPETGTEPRPDYALTTQALTISLYFE